MKQLAFELAGRLPARLWNRLNGNACAFPYYHMVSDDFVEHISPLYSFPSVRKFREDVDYFLSMGRPISVPDLVSALEKEGRPPNGRFLLTFDDGFREMHDIVLPILAGKGVPAAFFVTSASVDNRTLIHHQKIALLINHCRGAGKIVEQSLQEKLNRDGIVEAEVVQAIRRIPWESGRLVDELAAICGVDFQRYLQERKPYLTTAQLHAMQAQGMHIGAHSIDHPRYSEISLADQLRQTEESVEFVMEQCHEPVRTFAFPHSDEGVSSEFFCVARERNLLRLTFGTSAPLQDPNPWNIERFSMEKTVLSANSVVARNIFRGAKLRLTKRQIMRRRATS